MRFSLGIQLLSLSWSQLYSLCCFDAKQYDPNRIAPSKYYMHCLYIACRISVVTVDIVLTSTGCVHGGCTESECWVLELNCNQLIVYWKVQIHVIHCLIKLT